MTFRTMLRRSGTALLAAALVSGASLSVLPSSAVAAPAASSAPVDPTAALAASPNTGTSPLTVVLDTTGTLISGTDTWDLSFGDGTPDLTGDPTTFLPSYTHTYAAGAFKATLTVTQGVVVSTFPLAINVTAPPTTAALSLTGATGTAPSTVTFDGSASTNVGTWTLDYGDQTTVLTGSGAIAPSTLGTHVYLAGAYTARLSVVNGTTTSVAAGSVKVTGPAPDGSGTYDPATNTRSVDLWALADGSVTVAGETVPVWGFSASATTPPALPGPRLVATAGETLRVTVHNQLDATLPAGLSCPATCDAGPIGLDLPAVAGIPQAAAPEGATATDTFRLTAPGTYIYEAGNDPQLNRQIAMGLAGVLIVRSNLGVTTAYGTGGLHDSFTKEEVVALNEIDPEFNKAPFANDLDHTNPTYFFLDGAAYDPAKPAADPAKPGFDPSQSNPEFDVTTGDVVLVRYANLGLHDHSMGLVSMRQTEVARDSTLLPNPVNQRTEWLTAGQAADTFVQVSPAAPTGAAFPLYDAGLHLFNGAANGLGGMYTTFKVTSGESGSTAGPAVTCQTTDATCVTPIQVSSTDGATPAINTGTDLTVTVHLAAGAGHTVSAARWYLDEPDGSASPQPVTPTSGTFGATTASITFTIPWSTLQPLLAAGAVPPFGDHIIWVEGQDETGAWGQAAGDVVTLGTTAPLVSAVGLSPGTTNGIDTPSAVANTPAGQVAVSATATASLPRFGIQAAEACIVPKTGPAPTAADVTKCGKPGTNLALTVGSAGARITSVDGPVIVPTAAGSYWVMVSAQAALVADPNQSGWSPFLSFDPVTGAPVPDSYQVVQVVTPAQAPTMTGLAVAPNPNNGFQDGPGNLGLFAAVQVTGTAASPVGANVALAEAFLGTSYAQGTQTPPIPTYPNGSGFEMIPGNGHWGDAATKAVAAYIPLADIAAQPDGLVPIYVHAKDVAGNWGPLVEVDLTLDATAPKITGLAAGTGAQAGQVTVSANDPVSGGVSSGIVAAEWWTGPDPGTGKGHAFTPVPAAASPGATVSFTVSPGQAGGTAVQFRVKDAAGNWGAPMTVTV